MPRAVRLIGVGNRLRGDDGIGPVLIESVRGRLPDHVRASEHPGEFSTLMDAIAGDDAIVVVDAGLGDAAPGTVRRIAVGSDGPPRERPAASSHAGGLALALHLLDALGRRPPRIVLLAVAGAEFSLGASLSPPVRAAMPALERLVLDEVEAQADA